MTLEESKVAKAYGIYTTRHPNYFMARVVVPGGVLTTSQVRRLSKIIEAYAQGRSETLMGNVIRRETNLKTNLLTLDELDLQEGDWIDIGAPLVNGQVFPVTVKSLVFH